MVSVVTGLVFAYILAHELPVPASATDKTYYDLWFNVNDLTGYFTVMAGVLPFWECDLRREEEKDRSRREFLQTSQSRE